jgi:hypothetical protein
MATAPSGLLNPELPKATGAHYLIDILLECSVNMRADAFTVRPFWIHHHNCKRRTPHHAFHFCNNAQALSKPSGLFHLPPLAGPPGTHLVMGFTYIGVLHTVSLLLLLDYGRDPVLSPPDDDYRNMPAHFTQLSRCLGVRLADTGHYGDFAVGVGRPFSDAEQQVYKVLYYQWHATIRVHAGNLTPHRIDDWHIL